MADVAGWVALVATCVAALLTASNLSARVTGWGFVVFTFGAAAWIAVGLFTQQKQLLYSNVFLGLVDLFGIWRWLGRRAHMSDVAQAEEAHSGEVEQETLFSTSRIDGLPVRAAGGEVVATAVDALAACRGGRIDFLIVRVGGVGGLGERLHRLAWRQAIVRDGEISTTLTTEEIALLPEARTA